MLENFEVNFEEQFKKFEVLCGHSEGKVKEILECINK